MLEMSQRRTMGAAPARYVAQTQQPTKLMVALVLLLVALVAILVKDRQFWFGSEQATIEADLPSVASVATPAAAPVQTPTAAPPAPAAPAPAHIAKKPVAAAKTSSQHVASQTPAITTTRSALPPLDVEVVAGNNHRAVHPPNSATKVEVAKAEPEPPAASVTAPAAQREPVPVAATHLPQTAVHATYPVLAQHMNVQGSVVLEAVINADGTIQNLKVLSGPAILTSAAEHAVREWRFKPIYQNGQAVESKAKITVSFSIRVGDSTPSNTIAQGTASGDTIVNR